MRSLIMYSRSTTPVPSLVAINDDRMLDDRLITVDRCTLSITDTALEQFSYCSRSELRALSFRRWLAEQGPGIDILGTPNADPSGPIRAASC